MTRATYLTRAIAAGASPDRAEAAWAVCQHVGANLVAQLRQARTPAAQRRLLTRTAQVLDAQVLAAMAEPARVRGAA